MILSISEWFRQKLEEMSESVVNSCEHMWTPCFLRISTPKKQVLPPRHRSSASWRNAIEGCWRSRMPNAGSRTGEDVVGCSSDCSHCSGFTIKIWGFSMVWSCLIWYEEHWRASFSLTSSCHFGVTPLSTNQDVCLSLQEVKEELLQLQDEYEALLEKQATSESQLFSTNGEIQCRYAQLRLNPLQDIRD